MNSSIRRILDEIKPADMKRGDEAWARINSLTKPLGSLGRLEEIAAKLYAIHDGRMPESYKKSVYVFAGDHGVTAQGVSAFPKDVTHQMVYNFVNGGAAINVLARHAGADVLVVDIGVDFDFPRVHGLISEKVAKGTKDFTRGPAMTEEEAERAVLTGMEIASTAAERGYTLLAPGDMGIGNTTASSAVIAAVTGAPVADLVGYGTGIDEESRRKKVDVIERAIALNRPSSLDPLDILQKVGGLEIGGICGFVLGCAAKRIPVVADGFISAAGAALARLFNPAVLDYTFFSHRSVEKGHQIFYEYIGEKPMFDMNLRLGEGTGAALAFSFIEASARIYNEMATFEDAKVSGKVD